MAEVITDERLRKFVHSSVSNDFGLSVETVAEKCKNDGRFKAWLNSDVTRIKEVLNTVKDNGVSPAFFASYERTEGYNSKWGWLNHTSINGNPVTDSKSVSQWIVTQSKNTTDNPAWIDFANYKDFVPASVKTAGNADFKNMTSGSIGKVIIAGTAAATWEVYYPNGLLASYNGVQNYGAPINNMMNTILDSWGGTLDGTNTPDPDGEDHTGHVKNEAVMIVENGRVELKGKINLNDLKEIFEAPLFKVGNDFYRNQYFKIMKTFNNFLTINPTDELDLVSFDEIIDEVFNGIVVKIKQIKGGTNDGGDNGEVSSEMFFPVDFNQSGINFWTPPDQPNMDYGGQRSGRLHWAYDIGTLGNSNVSCHAVRSGKVLSVNADNLGTVVIKHTSDEYFTQYMHLKLGAFTVSTGDDVVAGQQIGIVGGTGGYDIHLHFAVSKNGTFATEIDTINPRPYLKITGNNVTGLPIPN